MKNKKMCQLMMIITIMVFIFFSCPDEAGGGDGGGGGGGGGELPPITPPIITINFQSDANGYIQYSTNDPAKLTSNGKTYWYPNLFNDAIDDYIEIDTAKSSGKANYGYGMIFCIQNDVVDCNSTVNNFYALLIRKDGYYCLIKVAAIDTIVNGVIKKVPKQHRVMLSGCDINGWKFSNLLYQGWGVYNKIKIIYQGKDPDGYSLYDIYFNGTAEINSYKDNFTVDGVDVLPLFDGDLGKKKFGFIVTLGPDEDFPLIPVNIFFKQNYPVYNKQSKPMMNKSAGINFKTSNEVLEDDCRNSGEF